MWTLTHSMRLITKPRSQPVCFSSWKIPLLVFITSLAGHIFALNLMAFKLPKHPDYELKATFGSSFCFTFYINLAIISHEFYLKIFLESVSFSSYLLTNTIAITSKLFFSCLSPTHCVIYAMYIFVYHTHTYKHTNGIITSLVPVVF